MPAHTFTVGSPALLHGEPVTIHQLLGNDTFLVLRKRGTRRCELAELTPVPARRTVERWIGLCLDRASQGLVRVPISELYDAYWNWMHDLGTRAADIPVRDQFVETMKLAGFRAVRTYPRGAFRRRGIAGTVWCFDVAPLAMVGAAA